MAVLLKETLRGGGGGGGGRLKVTVQFETEGSGQNEIVSRMDRQEVKLQNKEKNIHRTRF